jgi:hypothetical protein
MDSSAPPVLVTERDLAQFLEHASRLLTGVSWTRKAEVKTVEPGTLAFRESGTPEGIEEKIALLGVAKTLSKDPLLLHPDLHNLLLSLRKGAQLAMHISSLYTKFSGLDHLITLNGRGGLADAQRAEFRGKYHTAAVITVYALASFVVYDLDGYKSEEVSGLSIDFRGIPELSFQDPVRGLECCIFYLGKYWSDAATTKGPLEAVKVTQLYCRAVIDEVLARKESLSYTEPFTGQRYKLEHSEFTLDGFEAAPGRNEVSIEFNRVELSEIVGNREAKHDARRLAERLVCYDREAGKNPFLELGGLATITMGYGEPGTGKSLLIGALATLLHDYCAFVGLPFLFWPMPDTVVSTYQGGSAERMMQWMKVLREGGKIIYAPIDDAENNLEERTRQGVSAGVREVIGVFLRNTEGAYAVHRGNTLIQLFTNIPEQIDKAVLSRINKRSKIAGAERWEDFLDQDYLWYRRYNAVADGFIDQRPPSGYEYLALQQEVGSISELKAKEVIPSQERVREIFTAVQGRFSPDEHQFFATLYAEIKGVFPLFTSRDVRNIQRSVDARLSDFDLPQEWFSNVETFFRQPYETKKAMLSELMKSGMQGLSFGEIRLQESIAYLDAMVQIADTGKERRIAELVEEHELRAAASKRLGQG